MSGVWGELAGGTPWQLPQVTCPDDVHTGSDVPWQYELAHVCALRSQPSEAFTTGSRESMCPGESTCAGTAWHAVHATGTEIRELACRCAWCAPTPSAVVNVWPDRSTGGAGELALP